VTNSTEWLTQEQVDQLPDGTIVEITWSGGNGPHRYTTELVGYWVYAVSHHPNGRTYRVQDPISFVGSERFHTRVRLVDSIEPDTSD
jgi:hypothetical protein